MPRNWMGRAFSQNPGALHRQLGYRQSESLPHGLLDEIADARIGTHVRGYTVTRKLKSRAVAAVNARR